MGAIKQIIPQVRHIRLGSILSYRLNKIVVYNKIYSFISTGTFAKIYKIFKNRETKVTPHDN